MCQLKYDINIKVTSASKNKVDKTLFVNSVSSEETLFRQYMYKFIHPLMQIIAYDTYMKITWHTWRFIKIHSFQTISRWNNMCPHFILLIYTDGERDGLWMACPFRTLVVLYRMFPFIICLILMNYLMEFYFIGFVNAHLPGCFCPWTFRLNIGLNTSPSDSFVSYLNSHLGYSAGEFQALQLIVLAVFGAVD